MYHLPPIKGTRNSYWFVGCLRAFSNRGTSEVASGRRHQVGPQLGEVRKICFELRTTFCCGMKVQAFKLPNIWSLNLWKRFVLEAFQKKQIWLRLGRSFPWPLHPKQLCKTSFCTTLRGLADWFFHHWNSLLGILLGFPHQNYGCIGAWQATRMINGMASLHRPFSLMSFASTKVSRGPNGRPLLTTIMSGILSDFNNRSNKIQETVWTWTVFFPWHDTHHVKDLAAEATQPTSDVWLKNLLTGTLTMTCNTAQKLTKTWLEKNKKQKHIHTPGLCSWLGLVREEASTNHPVRSCRLGAFCVAPSHSWTKVLVERSVDQIF